jgi:hypothetical protein
VKAKQDSRLEVAKKGQHERTKVSGLEEARRHISQSEEVVEGGGTGAETGGYKGSDISSRIRCRREASSERLLVRRRSSRAPARW